MKKILKLNAISSLTNEILTPKYEYSDSVDNPHGIILRSFKMHDYEVKDNLLAIARAGAGVNNIPVDKMTEKGIVVFNTPGANSNAVKELVLAAMLMSSRKINEGIEWVKTLNGNEDVAKAVEKGKAQFVGPELSGKTLGVIGLGAIGAKVANAAVELNMTVLGYDPYISVDAAWKLSRSVIHAKDVDDMVSKCDYITIHMPYLPSTKDFINAERISLCKDGVKIINLARGELVNNEAIIAAVKSGKVGKYFTDFPCNELMGIDNIILCPHLGASTPEAEDNCAKMAAEELDDYLTTGNITNSVNFPNVKVPFISKHRITVVHKNITNMINMATKPLSEAGINISNMTSVSKGDMAYMIMDVDDDVPASVIDELSKTEGLVRIRLI